jgi:hypothetical protein
MQEHRQRASRSDIFVHLERLLGHEALETVTQVTARLNAGETEPALAELKAFDAKIGGVGLHEHQEGKKLPGVYRALSYVEMSLRTDAPQKFSRYIVYSACAHVESMLKRMARRGLFGQLREDHSPMGKLVNKIKKRLPPDLYTDLKWLSDGIANVAKHEYDLSDRGEREPEHLFELDEAIAVYLISRRLAVELERYGGKSRTVLLSESGY